MELAKDSRVRVRTRAAILTATASALAADRVATLPDIAASAGVSRTTLHRYFADRETLVYEAILDSICISAETVDEAALAQGSTAEAMRRLITALFSIADRVWFLFADRASLTTWIRHALYGLVPQGCAADQRRISPPHAW